MTSPIQTNLWGSVIKVSKPEGSGLGRVCAGPVCCAFACCVFLFLSVLVSLISSLIYIISFLLLAFALFYFF